MEEIKENRRSGKKRERMKLGKKGEHNNKEITKNN